LERIRLLIPRMTFGTHFETDKIRNIAFEVHVQCRSLSAKSVPVLTTDAQAGDFLEQDLSTLDFTQFKPMRFEALPKSAPTLKLRQTP